MFQFVEKWVNPNRHQILNSNMFLLGIKLKILLQCFSTYPARDKFTLLYDQTLCIIYQGRYFGVEALRIISSVCWLRLLWQSVISHVVWVSILSNIESLSNRFFILFVISEFIKHEFWIIGVWIIFFINVLSII